MKDGLDLLLSSLTAISCLMCCYTVTQGFKDPLISLIFGAAFLLLFVFLMKIKKL